MQSKFYGALAAALVLGGASAAHAGYNTIDLSPYVNQGFANGGWFIDGGNFQAALPGTTFGNQGSSVPFNVANVPDALNGGNLNFWFGLDNGSHTNLFGGHGVLLIPYAGPQFNDIHTLADNTFGRPGNLEFSLILADASLTQFAQYDYIGGLNTKDYNTPNCGTTGCTATPWFDDGSGIILQDVDWQVNPGFQVGYIAVVQQAYIDGAILAGITVGVPEPATWALMIGGFGLAGAALRRRRSLAAA